MSEIARTGSRMLEVEGLGHVYGDGAGAVEAIARLEFSVAEGELVSIVGPSGCGKTTLLKCISGLMRPTRGRVLLLGDEVSGVPKGLAIVFQDYSRSLFPWLTARRNVEFPLRRARVSRDERSERVAESLHAVGLADVGNRYPWQLSGGMQQRVAIARALAWQPRLMLMDEPFAAVDAQTRADLEDLTLSIRDRFGVTILFVTHDIDESVYLADRVIVLSACPSHVEEIVPVDLPPSRNQITTRELDAFVRLRGEVARRIRRPPRPEPSPATEGRQPTPASNVTGQERGRNRSEDTSAATAVRRGAAARLGGLRPR